MLLTGLQQKVKMNFRSMLPVQRNQRIASLELICAYSSTIFEETARGRDPCPGSVNILP